MSLRSVRFVVLVVFALAAAFAYASATGVKLTLTKVYTGGADATDATFLADVKLQLSNYNALFGTIMFAGSKIFEVYTETLIYPTLHTYLHNCSLYPGDQPQRVHSKVKANAIFWGLKSIVIFMNVGFASLYVGQSAMASSGSRRLETAAVSASEMAVLVSRSPVAAWELSGVNEAIVSASADVQNTILRSAMSGVTIPFDADGVAAARCRGQAGAHLLEDLDTTSVAFGFPVHEWSAGVLRSGIHAKSSVQFSVGELMDQRARIEQQASDDFGIEIAATAQELVTQGMAVLRGALGQSSASSSLSSTSSFGAAVEQSVSALNATLPLAVGQLSDIKFGIAAHDLTADVSLVSMTIDVPVSISRELDGAEVLCGSRSGECVLSHTLDARLRSEVSVLPYTRSEATRDGDENNTAFLFGLGRTVSARPTKEPAFDPSDVALTISLTFAKMAWRSTALHVRHGTECADASQCLGLSVPMSSAWGDGVVLVGKDALPSDHLSASATNPLQLVTLNSAALPSTRGSSATWDRITGGMSSVNGDGCAGALVDAYVGHLEENRLSLETPLQVLYTSALLYLVQNGVFTEYAIENGDGRVAVSRKLLLAASPGDVVVEIEVGIPTSSSIATFAGCGVMVLLMVFVIFFPTERVKLSPNTTPAAQYVQILTDDLYPDIVHKKRLRFANGDGLLFNEYVVDAIVLHAKRNEKKKIFL